MKKNNSFLDVLGDLKTTRGRIKVVEYLKQMSTPVDVSEIESYLVNHDTPINTSTIYRIIREMYRKRIVTRFELQEGKFRYELASKKPDHHHLICEQCGEIEDISDCAIPALEKDIKRKKGFLVKRHTLEFFGACKQCQR